MPTKSYYISGATDLTEQEMIERIIVENSEKHGIETALIKAIIKQESGYELYSRRYDYSRLRDTGWAKKAIADHNLEAPYCWYSVGLMQVLYCVAVAEYAFEGTFQDFFNPRHNIDIGCRHLKKRLKRYGIRDAISAYNAGSPTLGNKENYTDPVYKEYKKLGGKL